MSITLRYSAEEDHGRQGTEKVSPSGPYNTDTLCGRKN